MDTEPESYVNRFDQPMQDYWSVGLVDDGVVIDVTNKIDLPTAARLLTNGLLDGFEVALKNLTDGTGGVYGRVAWLSGQQPRP